MYSQRPSRALFCPCRRLRRALSRRSVPLASLVVLTSLTLLFAVAPHPASAAVAQHPSLTAVQGTNDCDAGKKSQLNCQGQDQQQKTTVTIGITNVITLPPAAAPTATPTPRPTCCIQVVTPCCQQAPPCCVQPTPVCCMQPTPLLMQPMLHAHADTMLRLTAVPDVSARLDGLPCLRTAVANDHHSTTGRLYDLRAITPPAPQRSV
jgi:hypothetical protein